MLPLGRLLNLGYATGHPSFVMPGFYTDQLLVSGTPRGVGGLILAAKQSGLPSSRSARNTHYRACTDGIWTQLIEFVIKKYRLTVEQELQLQKICDVILKLLDEMPISTADSGESKVFYQKMKAGYYHCITEFRGVQILMITEGADGMELTKDETSCFYSKLDVFSFLLS